MPQKGNKALFINNNKLQTNRNSLGKNRYRKTFNEKQKINSEINYKWLNRDKRGKSPATSSAMPIKKDFVTEV